MAKSPREYLSIDRWSTPKGFRPNALILNFRQASAKLGRRIELRLGREARALSVLYPPPWQSAGPLVSESVYRLARYWLILLPLLVGFFSVLPLTLGVSGVTLSLGNNFQWPFSFKLSFLSAFCLFVAATIYRLRCPPLIRDYPPNFGSMPPNLHPDELIRLLREYVLSGLPRELSFRSVRISRARGEPFRSDVPKTYEAQTKLICVPEIMFLPALAKIYSEVATPGQTNLVHSTDLPTTRRFTQLGASSIEDPTPDRRGNIWRLLEEKCKTGNVELKARDIESLWACEECLTPACNKLARFAFGYLETKDAPAVFAMLYLAMNNDRPIDRMIFWAFYVIGFASAAIVVLQIIYRGILLILLS